MNATPTERRWPSRSRRRASLGTGRLWSGAVAIVALRIVYDLVQALIEPELMTRHPGVAVAWTVLIVADIAVVVATRALGEHLPTWMFAMFAAALGIATALDMLVAWNSPEPTGHLVVAAAAATSVILASTTRAPVEVIALAAAITVSAVMASVVSQETTPTAAELATIAQMLIPSIVLVAVVSGFRSFVHVELDRRLVQATVAAPRLALGMLASEQLARLDLAAEELLSDVADGRIRVPLTQADAARAGTLATELRLHLLEGRKQTWLYHAISESGRLGRSVSVADPDSLAGLLAPGQRDGLLSTIWLLLDPRADRGSQRSVTVRIGPMQSLPGAARLVVVPIVLATTGANRTRVDPAIWAELQRIGQYWDSVDGGSLRLDIRCVTTSGTQTPV